MSGLADTLAFEFRAFSKCRADEEIHTTLMGISDRIRERLTTEMGIKNPPSSTQVAEVLAEHMKAIAAAKSNAVAYRTLEDVASALRRYFALFDAEAAKPLIGLPSNPFDGEEA